MSKNKNYDWMIMFFLFASAAVRFAFHFIPFNYIDYFVAIISLIGLDYTVTNILNSMKDILYEIIDNKLDIATKAKINKKNRIKKFVHVIIFLIIIYNIIHFLRFSCSTGNDMLSMIVLAISLTDNSIISFLVKNNYVIKDIN